MDYFRLRDIETVHRLKKKKKFFVLIKQFSR